MLGHVTLCHLSYIFGGGLPTYRSPIGGLRLANRPQKCKIGGVNSPKVNQGNVSNGCKKKSDNDNRNQGVTNSKSDTLAKQKSLVLSKTGY